MRRPAVVITCFLLLATVAGCSGLFKPPAAIRHALDVQAEYTAHYVERTLPLVKDEETRLVGIELVKNAAALARWAHVGESANEKENPKRD